MGIVPVFPEGRNQIRWVTCTMCGAPPGQSCDTRSGASHQKRVERWAAMKLRPNRFRKQ
ncbi:MULTISPECIES: zinc finger domain-containing protein [Gordonia]|uniref:zinc finger domain-containing protein n=1 Tax=Gordonia TaxID=2053 RepID=UPI003F703E96